MVRGRGDRRGGCVTLKDGGLNPEQSNAEFTGRSEDVWNNGAVQGNSPVPTDMKEAEE